MEYEPGIVYRNLFRFLAYRKLNTSVDRLDDDKLSEIMRSIGYLTIEATRQLSDTVLEKTIIILMAPGTKYAVKSPEFKKLLNDIVSKRKEYTMNYIIVTAEEVNTFVSRVLADFSVEGLKYEQYTYKMFKLVVPEHELVPKHEFATRDEIEEQLNIYYRNISSFPKINVRDPPVVWLGAKIGDTIKITRPSENALSAVVYRVVTK